MFIPKKTKAIAMAISMSLVGAAQAVHMSDNGLGQVLIYPYYNTNNSIVTSISIINTTSAYKAVKVRFREAKGSNDVLDFNLYMSPKDVWTGTIANDGSNGLATLTTTDRSCTLPSLFNADGSPKTVPFRSVYIDVNDTDATEGYVEVIEMGEIVTTRTPTGGNLAPVAAGTIAHGILHNPATNAPFDCSVVSSAWTNGGFTEGGAATRTPNLGASGFNGVDGSPLSAATVGTRNILEGTTNPAGLTTPGGGLAGSTILVNVNQGRAFVADPVVIDHYAAAVTDANADGLRDDPGLLGFIGATGAQHYLSDDVSNYLLPSLASGNVAYSSVNVGTDRQYVYWGPTVINNAVNDPVATLGTGLAAAGASFNSVVDFGEVNGVAFDINNNGIDDANETQILPAAVPSGVNPMPMAHVLSVNNIYNEYAVNDLAGQTDVVVTLPMKKYGVFAPKRPDGTGTNYRDVIGVTNGGKISYAFTSWNREEQQTAGAAAVGDFSPPISNVQIDVFDREVNILNITTGNTAIDPTQTVLGSTQSAQFRTVGFDNGWFRIGFNATHFLNDSVTHHQDFVPTSRPTFWQGPINSVAGTAADRLPSTLVGNSLAMVPAIGFAALTADFNNLPLGEAIPHRFTHVIATP